MTMLELGTILAVERSFRRPGAEARVLVVTCKSVASCASPHGVLFIYQALPPSREYSPIRYFVSQVSFLDARFVLFDGPTHKSPSPSTRSAPALLQPYILRSSRTPMHPFTPRS